MSKETKNPLGSLFVGNPGVLAVLATMASQKRDRLSTVSLMRESFVSLHSPYGLRSETKGLSHGLKIARQLSIFTPVCGLVSPFQVPPGHKKTGTRMCVCFFGARGGT